MATPLAARHGVDKGEGRIGAKSWLWIRCSHGKGITMVSDQRPPDRADPAEEAALGRALEDVPRGAVAVAGIAVALLLICWFAIYLFVFLPRGSVG